MATSHARSGVSKAADLVKSRPEYLPEGGNPLTIKLHNFIGQHDE